jgi:hypothetical protein
MDMDDVESILDSSSDEDSDEDEQTKAADDDDEWMMIRLQSIMLYMAVTGSFTSWRTSVKRDRKGNTKRDREYHQSKIDTWSDELFKRQFRLCREDFNTVLGKIIEYLGGDQEVKRREDYGRRSYGSPILLKTKLMITLRMLAGASYLDMIWYDVSEESVHSIFKQTIELIDAALDNAKLPTTDEGWKELSDGWSSKSVAAKGGD